jgi:hypothetical protein
MSSDPSTTNKQTTKGRKEATPRRTSRDREPWQALSLTKMPEGTARCLRAPCKGFKQGRATVPFKGMLPESTQHFNAYVTFWISLAPDENNSDFNIFLITNKSATVSVLKKKKS